MTGDDASFKKILEKFLYFQQQVFGVEKYNSGTNMSAYFIRYFYTVCIHSSNVRKLGTKSLGDGIVVESVTGLKHHLQSSYKTAGIGVVALPTLTPVCVDVSESIATYLSWHDEGGIRILPKLETFTTYLTYRTEKSSKITAS